MLWSDARVMWNGIVMPDARVIHFWDGERKIGSWFAEHVDGYEGIAWDAYYLYGPDAKWETVPSPLLGSGGPIVYEQAALKKQASMLLEK
jgi:hypothetical protein